MSSNLINDDAFDAATMTAALNGQHTTDRNQIWMNMFRSPDWSTSFTLIDGIQDRELLWNFDLDFEVQPQVDYTAWDPQIDVIETTPRYLQTQEMKIDMEFIPMKMYRTYWGKMTDPKGDQFQMGPYTWMIAHITEYVQKIMRLRALYKGVYNAGGSTTVDTMDGRNQLIADEIVAGNLIPVVTGAITSGNCVDTIEAMCLAHDTEVSWADENTILPVSPTVFNWYWMGRRDKYPASIIAFDPHSKIKEMVVEGFNVTLQKEYGLTGSQRLAIYQKSMAIIGADSFSKTNNMDFQVEKRVINGLLDWKQGFNYAHLFDGAITVNDQT